MTADDAAFLAAIQSAPADRVTRLVYADYLEDRGDPRHELIRVCERMRELAVFSDDYWHLKARRNELRPTCPADWLAATGYDGSDYDPVFRSGWPDDWRGRWRIIREFTERWHGIPMPDIGGRLAEIAAEEARLGLTLPASVREYVAYAYDLSPGADRPVSVHHERLTMELNARRDALSLIALGEDDMDTAVLCADFDDPDPPVRWAQRTDDSDFRCELQESDAVRGGISDATFVFANRTKPAADEFWLPDVNRNHVGDEMNDTGAILCGLTEARATYEHPAGVLVTILSSDLGCVLHAATAPGLDLNALPDFLRGYATRRTWGVGRFSLY